METLTLEQASYLAEIIGVFAVVISLIYLAIQVRAGNQASLINAFATLAPRFDKFFELLTIPDNANLFLAASEDYESMDNVQKLRYKCLLAQCANVLEDGYLMKQAGVHAADLTGRELPIHQFLKTPGGRVAWKDMRLMMDKGVRNIIDDIAEANGEKEFNWG